MARPFSMGIDVGTSRVAVATAQTRLDGALESELVPLGDRHDNAPAVAFIDTDGELLVGDAAQRRGLLEPERLIPEFRRGIGDNVPFMVADHEIRAERIFAQTVAEAIETVTQREGTPPDAIMVTHPSTWGPHRTGLIRAALAEVGHAQAELMSEPEAVARYFDDREHWQPAQTLVVYDLGGTSFQATLLRKRTDGTFEVLGEPVCIDDVGGVNFDDAVFGHVLASTSLATADPEATDVGVALVQLRRECADAKEALSVDTDVTIPVLGPPSPTTVRLTRAEFEAMIEPALDRTVDAVEDAVDGAGLAMTDVTTILLTGGSSRIPRVAQRLSEAFDRAIMIATDPKASVAMGAALTAMRSLADRAAAQSVALAIPEEAPAGNALQRAANAEPGEAVLVNADFTAATVVNPNRWRSLLTHGAVAVTGAAVVVVGGWLGGFTLAAVPAAQQWTPSTTAAQDVRDNPQSGTGSRLGSGAGEQSATAEEVTAALNEQSAAGRRGIPADDRPSSSARPGPTVGAAAAPTAAQSTAAGSTTNSTSVITNPTTAAQQTATTRPSSAASSSSTTSQPQPSPAPAADPSPDPVQDPSPAPAPDPSPVPVPDPSPAPAPEPSPAPAPEPSFDPAPSPSPDPIPDPTPTSEPEPTVVPSEPASV
ncbi:MAG: Hsp70 family protein [Brooklawnia sp.]|nr:Hsp70 family protein [Brooklawnia sp.]